MYAPMKVRSDFVTFARADRMALSTACLEKLSTSLRVTLKGIGPAVSYLQRLVSFILLTGSVRHC